MCSLPHIARHHKSGRCFLAVMRQWTMCPWLPHTRSRPASDTSNPAAIGHHARCSAGQRNYWQTRNVLNGDYYIPTRFIFVRNARGHRQTFGCSFIFTLTWRVFVTEVCICHRKRNHTSLWPLIKKKNGSGVSGETLLKNVFFPVKSSC